MDYTSRLLLQKPDPDPVTGDFLDVSVLNANFDALDAVVSFTPATSTARPSDPFQGQGILETDTGKAYVWGGSAYSQMLTSGAAYDFRIGLGRLPSNNIARLLYTWGPGGGSVPQVTLQTSATATGHRALSVLGGSDTQDRWWTDFDGNMQWGPGNAGGDTNLYRSAAGTLKTDSALVVGGTAQVGGRGVVTGSGTSPKVAVFKGNVTFDSLGLATVTHGAGFTPAAIGVSQNGLATGTGAVQLFTINGTETSTAVQVKCMNAGGTAVLAGSVGITLTMFA